MERRYLRFGWMWLLMMAVCCSCSDNEHSDGLGMMRQATMTLLAEPDGVGDNGYYDCALEGLFSFVERTGTRMNLLQPLDKQEAEQMLRKWLNENVNRDSSVLVVGGHVYEDMVARANVELTGKGSRVLLFESLRKDFPADVSAFAVNRYGAGYLAGAMSGLFDALVWISSPGNVLFETAAKGFQDGHEKHRAEGCSVTVNYLAADEGMFVSSDSVYRAASLCESLSSSEGVMLFPLLGASASGLVHYLNDEGFTSSLMIGMDVDYTGRCTRVPFSLVTRIGNVLNQYLTDWLEGREWPTWQSFGLQDGITDVVMTPGFLENLDMWDWRYEEEGTFLKLYEQYKNEAIIKEEEYDGYGRTE